jgi:hypothetical protein
MVTEKLTSVGVRFLPKNHVPDLCLLLSGYYLAVAARFTTVFSTCVLQNVSGLRAGKHDACVVEFFTQLNIGGYYQPGGKQVVRELKVG